MIFATQKLILPTEIKFSYTVGRQIFGYLSYRNNIKWRSGKTDHILFRQESHWNMRFCAYQAKFILLK